MVHLDKRPIILIPYRPEEPMSRTLVENRSAESPRGLPGNGSSPYKRIREDPDPEWVLRPYSAEKQFVPLRGFKRVWKPGIPVWHSINTYNDSENRDR